MRRREVAKRNRAEAIRQRVEDERLRVAQEVHDVVGHGLAAIKVTSDVALHVMSNKLLITITNPAEPDSSIGDGLGVRGMRRRQWSAPRRRTHVSRARAKLSARDSAQLVVFVYQSGLAVDFW